MLPLFEAYPKLKSRLAHQKFCELPSPVEQMNGLSNILELKGLYVKRDDLSGPEYGGNKSRKMEFLMADALQRGKKEVMVFGFAGSNFCLSSALYSKKVGLKSISMLLPQPPEDYVSTNLLLSHKLGAELHHSRSVPLLTISAVWQLGLHALKSGRLPLMIPAGGSSVQGVVAFVNAAFELKNQIDAGLIPEPDFIYGAMGSMGTAVGLSIGLKALGLKTKVVAVRVVEKRFAEENSLIKLSQKTVKYLGSLDPDFPRLEPTLDDVIVNHAFFGREYGHFTTEAREAMDLAWTKDSIQLDGTYTGKAMAALIQDARTGQLNGKNVLFWNTFNSRDISSRAKDVDYKKLPKKFQRYF